MLASKSPLLFLHIAGLTMSVGLVFLLDLRLLRLLLGRPVTRSDIELTYFAQPVIRLGLTLLWVSGLGFLIQYWEYDSHLLSNPKIYAKLLIVTVLTLNGVVLERYAFKQLTKNLGLPIFAGVSFGREAFLLGLAAVSAISWLLPLALGTIKELDFAASASSILIAYALLIVSAFMGLVSIRFMFHRPHLIGDYFARI